jgi:hypothetical protein
VYVMRRDHLGTAKRPHRIIATPPHLRQREAVVDPVHRMTQPVSMPVWSQALSNAHDSFVIPSLSRRGHVPLPDRLGTEPQPVGSTFPGAFSQLCGASGLSRRMLSLLLRVSQCFSTSDGPVSLLSLGPSCGVSSVGISSRRGSSLPGRGARCKVCGPSLAVSGPGGVRDAWA